MPGAVLLNVAIELRPMDVGDLVFMRRTLLGIRARAERAHARGSPAAWVAGQP